MRVHCPPPPLESATGTSLWSGHSLLWDCPCVGRKVTVNGKRGAGWDAQGGCRDPGSIPWGLPRPSEPRQNRSGSLKRSCYPLSLSSSWGTGVLRSWAAAGLGRGPRGVCGLCSVRAGFLGRLRLLGSIGSPVPVCGYCVCVWLRVCILPGPGTGASVCLLEWCPHVCPACVCRVSVSEGHSEVEGGGAGKGNRRALVEGCVVCMCTCVHTPQRCSGLPSHGVVARRQGQSCQIFCWLCWIAFLFCIFPLSFFFPPLFLSSFYGFYFSYPRGRGQAGQRTLVVVAPTAPGAQSRHPPGAERPLPGGSRRWSRDLGISRSRDPSPQRTTFERRACLPWQRFVPQPDLSLTRPGRVPHALPPGKRDPCKERPLAPLFPFSVRGCLP